MEVCAPRSPRLRPLAGTGSTMVVLKEAVLAIQQDPPGTGCHLSQGQKLTPRKGRGEGGLCNFHLYHDLQEKPRFYCC